MYNFYSKKLVQPPGCAPNILLVMKLTTIILITAILQVSASTFAQKISLTEKNTPLNKIFEKISDQTGYDFLVSTENLKKARLVTINIQNEELKSALDRIFSEQPLSFVIQEKMVVVSKKEGTPLNKIKETLSNPVIITGKVTDTTGAVLPGATIKIKGTAKATVTDSQGLFTINAEDGDEIEVSFIGFDAASFKVKADQPFQRIMLHTSASKLNAVTIVSTGYQTIPKERATGSFVHIDSTLVTRRVSTNILDRLDGVTSGLLFNKSLGNGNNPAISIRGRSTIFSNPDPLIVLDNFPYEGDLNNINPNDIESISILKDAAAASIWGVRAGNGVIVITTKKGKRSKTPHISFNANTTVTGKVDLGYQPQISSSDFIDMEQYLFRRGYYDNTISDGYSTISPALAIFLQKRNGQISALDSASSVNKLKTYDIRKDVESYIYRRAVNQQYAISIDGASDTHSYYLSAGYDKNLTNIVANSYNRFTLNANSTYQLLDNRLQLSAAIMLTTSKTNTNHDAYTNPLYPYEQLVDANGNHLSIVQTGGLRKQYTDTTGTGKLLDWNYRPLDENTSNNSTTLTDYKLNANLKYKIVKGLDFLINYQYEKGLNQNTQLHDGDSYYTRNLINSFSHIDPSTGTVTRPVPLGAIENIGNNSYTSNYVRGQINYVKKIGERHELNALAGVETKDYQAMSVSNTLYGFNTSDDSSVPVDFLTYFPQYYGFGSNRIPYGAQQNYSVDRIRSAFFNGSYTYNGLYTVSASARRDESNIFGVKSNQKGVPLWSTGFLWNLSKEKFYHFDLIPVLKLRATYGYNGNVDKTTSAYLTAQNSGTNYWNNAYNAIINPPNPSLRWEKDRNVNFGLDFVSKKNLFSGSIDYYIKNGIDLIGNSPIAPQTGIVQFKGNSADTKTSGIDLILNKNSVSDSKMKWNSSLLFSYSKDIITNYKVKQGNNAQIINGNYVNPVEGYPYNAIFSYSYKGLDNQGRPQGMLNGVISEDYAAIQNSTDLSNLVYNGSATPLFYGSFRNTFSYQEFDLSFNITYKFDYYFRRPNVFSGSNSFGSYGFLAADYDKRWQNPGDESRTNIPALSYPANNAQDGFFQGASVLVEKADNIRLQDVRLAYHFRSLAGNPIFRNLQIYAYLTNVGILWKATKQTTDPDFVYSSYVNPKSLSIGLSTNF